VVLAIPHLRVGARLTQFPRGLNRVRKGMKGGGCRGMCIVPYTNSAHHVSPHFAPRNPRLTCDGSLEREGEALAAKQPTPRPFAEANLWSSKGRHSATFVVPRNLQVAAPRVFMSVYLTGDQPIQRTHVCPPEIRDSRDVRRLVGKVLQRPTQRYLGRSEKPASGVAMGLYVCLSYRIPIQR
jgi:hypothetical protein